MMDEQTVLAAQYLADNGYPVDVKTLRAVLDLNAALRAQVAELQLQLSTANVTVSAMGKTLDRVHAENDALVEPHRTGAQVGC